MDADGGDRQPERVCVAVVVCSRRVSIGIRRGY